MENEIIENCQVEWQKDRGVLYVHNKETGATVIRICGLSQSTMIAKLSEGQQIDITNPHLVSYSYDVKLIRNLGGRPKVEVDVKEAIKLRSEGLSYQQISEKLGNSLTVVYASLPKEIKKKYRNIVYDRKVGRPRKGL